MTSNELQLKLIEICQKVAQGDYEEVKSLMELAPGSDVDESVAVLAEAIGLMSLRIEARELELSRLLRELEKSQTELLRHEKKLVHENLRLRKELKKFNVDVPVGQSQVMKELLERTKRMAAVDSPVFITGETGTGKSMLARYIHNISPRATKPLVSINCSAIPADIIDNELFGVEAGVTTPIQARIGRFEQANGGCIFLDEIGDMPLSTQAKLLHLIETGCIERVGGTRSIKVDVRIIAATTQNLKRNIKYEKFREDLFYRLNVMNLHVPPLRERFDDVPFLARHILSRHSISNPLIATKIDNESLQLLMQHSWQGNVRELENVLERAALFAKDNTIIKQDIFSALKNESPVTILPLDALQASVSLSLADKDQQDKSIEHIPSLQEVEDKFIIEVYTHLNYNKSLTARVLGVSREGLRIKLDKLKDKFSNKEQEA